MTCTYRTPGRLRTVVSTTATVCLALHVALLSCPPLSDAATSAGTYYVDSSNGYDDHEVPSARSAWKSLARLDSIEL